LLWFSPLDLSALATTVFLELFGLGGDLFIHLYLSYNGYWLSGILTWIAVDLHFMNTFKKSLLSGVLHRRSVSYRNRSSFRPVRIVRLRHRLYNMTAFNRDNCSTVIFFSCVHVLKETCKELLYPNSVRFWQQVGQWDFQNNPSSSPRPAFVVEVPLPCDRIVLRVFCKLWKESSTSHSFTFTLVLSYAPQLLLYWFIILVPNITCSWIYTGWVSTLL